MGGCVFKDATEKGKKRATMPEPHSRRSTPPITLPPHDVLQDSRNGWGLGWGGGWALTGGHGCCRKSENGKPTCEWSPVSEWLASSPSSSPSSCRVRRQDSLLEDGEKTVKRSKRSPLNHQDAGTKNFPFFSLSLSLSLSLPPSTAPPPLTHPHTHTLFSFSPCAACSLSLTLLLLLTLSPSLKFVFATGK